MYLLLDLFWRSFIFWHKKGRSEHGKGSASCCKAEIEVISGYKSTNQTIPLFTFSVFEVRLLTRISVFSLGIDEEGIIKFLDSKATSAQEACDKHHGFEKATCTTLKPLQFLFPGLIDSHLHAPQWPNLAVGMEVRNEQAIRSG
jgi:hypothetical protein